MSNGYGFESRVRSIPRSRSVLFLGIALFLFFSAYAISGSHALSKLGYVFVPTFAGFVTAALMLFASAASNKKRPISSGKSAFVASFVGVFAAYVITFQDIDASKLMVPLNSFMSGFCLVFAVLIYRKGGSRSRT